MKHCIDCKHYLLESPDALPVCSRSVKPLRLRNGFTEWLVTGQGEEPKGGQFYNCQTERTDPHVPTSCGLEAKHFYPKDQPKAT